MKAQQPAEGIMVTRNYGDAISYRLDCECGQDWHSHNVWIEAEESGVTVNTYVELKTDYWTATVNPKDVSPWLEEFTWAVGSIVNGLVRRVKMTWAIWTQGAVAHETTISMTAQQALNYSASLARAVKDVELYRNGRRAINENNAAVRAADQGDCV